MILTDYDDTFFFSVLWFLSYGSVSINIINVKQNFDDNVCQQSKNDVYSLFAYDITTS